MTAVCFFTTTPGNLLPFVIPCSKITVNGEKIYIEKLTAEEFQGIVKLLEALGMTFKASKRNEVVILRRVDWHERNPCADKGNAPAHKKRR